MPHDDSAGLATALLLAGGAAAMFLVARGAGREEARAEVARPRQGLSRRFDVVFDLYRGDIPLEYLRALAKRESNMHPHERSGPAWGLLQVVEVVRRDYNARHGTAYTRRDLLRPTVNVAIACEALHRIAASYARNHPNVPNLQADWDNPRFVELLTFGWNAGYSEAGGVGRVARYLEQQGVTDLTIDVVHEHASAAGASRHLQNAEKVTWCKSVAELYRLELRGLDEPDAA